jgi:quercetin dioxygenase-like cupin family protein
MTLMFALLLGLAPGVQTASSSLAPPGVMPIIDNPRVRVWDFTWVRGRAWPLHRHERDAVGIYLTTSAVRTTIPGGAYAVSDVKAGDVVFWNKGIEHQEESAAATPARVVVIELKDDRVALLANTTKYPTAFPRSGSRKLLENGKVIVWDYTWTPGEATPMHFHDKDVVVVYLQSGALQSTTADGKSIVNEVSPGMTRFNARNRTHSEMLVKGESRAIVTELK